MNKRQAKYVATIGDYKEVFSSEKGGRILYDMCKKFHFFNTSFDDSNPHTTSFQEGERNVLVYIISKLKQNEKILTEMLQREQEETDELNENY